MPGRIPRLSLATFITLAVALTIHRTARAEDYFLTVGGGYSPLGNQISLEKNVLFLQRLLAEEKPGLRHDILFSDGASPQRDLQFAADNVPQANQFLARLFHNEKYLGLEYRNHEVPGIRDGSSRDSLRRWFDEVGAKLKSGDRLFFYATAHGGKSGDKNKPYDTKLYLWNGESIRVEELVEHFDSLPAGVSVVSVMVQCYSGGFAHTIFNDGDASKGISPQARCGFYATRHDRIAAGCTPDIAEEDYHEFSSDFWAALGGKSRTGQPIERPDYDGDGQVSFEEAFAYTVLVSNTIDIPNRTSGAFLRAISKLESKEHADLVQADAPYDELLALANPAERAMLEGLSAQLELANADRYAQAKQKADEVEKQRKTLQGKIGEIDKKAKSIKEEIKKHLLLKWPELGNLLGPSSVALLTNQPEQFVAAVEAEPRFSELNTLLAEQEQLATERLDLERRWAKCQRFERALEEVALAANLSKVADEATQQRYRQLRAAEASTLAAVSPEAVSWQDFTAPRSSRIAGQTVRYNVPPSLEADPQSCE
ncbi:MAG: hypothetical protein KDA42_02890 [Planctomycetales bacterium]|nr:hypothetical protein [Planctomycetales bacterium]